jgi:hypothetical protein
MPTTGSNKGQQQRSRIRRRLEEAGMTDDEAAARAADAVGREDDVSARRSGAGSRQGDPAPRERSRR